MFKELFEVISSAGYELIVAIAIKSITGTNTAKISESFKYKFLLCCLISLVFPYGNGLPNIVV